MVKVVYLTQVLLFSIFFDNNLAQQIKSVFLTDWTGLIPKVTESCASVKEVKEEEEEKAV